MKQSVSTGINVETQTLCCKNDVEESEEVFALACHKPDKSIDSDQKPSVSEETIQEDSPHDSCSQ